MAEPFDIPQNPFGQSLSHAHATATSWAQSQATVDMQRAQLEEQQKQHQMMKQDFMVNFMKQKTSDFNSFFMMPEGKLKNTMADQWKERYAQPGMPDGMTAEQADQRIAASHDEEIQKHWSAYQAGMASSDPDVQRKTLLEQGPQLFGTEMTTTLFKDLNDKLIVAKATVDSKKFAAETTGMRQETARQDRAHQNVLRQVKQNPTLKARLTQINNLDNSLSLITDVDVVTPQQFREFQQSVRSNLGIKGSSGVQEREDTYLKDLGMNAAVWKQFLTGKPEDISKDPALLNHVKQLASAERSNARLQFDSNLDFLTAGNEDMYDKRPDLQRGLMSLVKAAKGTTQTPAEMKGNSEVPVEAVKVTPEQMRFAGEAKRRFEEAIAAEPKRNTAKFKALFIQEAIKSGVPESALSQVGLR